MCGIFAKIAKNNVVPAVKDSLTKLEYRGYDSVGVGLLDQESLNFFVRKIPGRVANLEADLWHKKSNVALGHTRWATHGEVNELNSHPHLYGRILLVHNGIVRNFYDLRKRFSDLKSETDSEVLAAYLDHCLNFFKANKDPIVATAKQFFKEIEGDFALVFLDQYQKDLLIGMKSNLPLLVGKASDGYVLASDVGALLDCEEVYDLPEQALVVVSTEKLLCFNARGEAFTPIKMNLNSFEQLELHDKDPIMWQEICQEPVVLKNLLKRNFDLPPAWQDLKVIACGSSFFAGLALKVWLQKLAGIEVTVEIGSEAATSANIGSRNLLLISQSGETADIIGALKSYNQKDYKIFGIVNVSNSTLAKAAQKVWFCYAGMEYSVASTKSFIAQLVVCLKLALLLAKKKTDILDQVPQLISGLIERQHKIKELAKEAIKYKNILIVAKDILFPAASEGALKIKELCYIHAESYLAGELKHGSIALVDDTCLVFVLVSPFDVDRSMIAYEQVKARGAKVILLKSGDELLPSHDKELAPIVFSSFFHILAYHMAVLLGRNVDRPRNLAKAVTVE